ncbi:uncharacterized protein LOC131023621 [Salvia miltiorrhiza]|uniref:uncharacterized protein LOC131023621 n=1 Tax=Salvia miltiorrhiza TaxID=226208 RepID=UPI0025ABDBDD|nr:uncharacterized protein LOC131023621 [Salvia miltiorrhiza]
MWNKIKFKIKKKKNLTWNNPSQIPPTSSSPSPHFPNPALPLATIIRRRPPSSAVPSPSPTIRPLPPPPPIAHAAPLHFTPPPCQSLRPPAFPLPTFTGSFHFSPPAPSPSGNTEAVVLRNAKFQRPTQQRRRVCRFHLVGRGVGWRIEAVGWGGGRGSGAALLVLCGWGGGGGRGEAAAGLGREIRFEIGGLGKMIMMWIFFSTCHNMLRYQFSAATTSIPAATVSFPTLG